MNSPAVESLAVVVAMTDPATPALVASLARFAEEIGQSGEVILVDASGTSASLEHASLFRNVRLIARPVGRLAPMLWRDGLLSTDASLVALTTAHMIPSPGWLDSLVSRLRQADAAGVGGPIEPGSSLSNSDRAMALLRYSSYFTPLPDPARIDPPGDNALYRRGPLMDVESAWADGFWEVDVHKALRDRGEVLRTAPSAVVTFEGGAALISMLRQRFRHARYYGAGRSRGLTGLARLARAFASPLVPFLLGSRAIRALRVRRMPLTPWLTAMPTFIILASAWAFGEAVGIWQGGVILSDNQRHDLVPQLTGKAR